MILQKKRAMEVIGKVCEYEEGMITEDKELADAFVDVSVLIKELQSYEKSLKATLVEKEIEPVYFSDREVKVFLEKSKKKTIYEMGNIISKCSENDILDQLAQVTSITANKITDDMPILKGVAEEFSHLSDEETFSTAKIKKMSKKELREQA